MVATSSAHTNYYKSSSVYNCAFMYDNPIVYTHGTQNTLGICLIYPHDHCVMKYVFISFFHHHHHSHAIFHSKSLPLCFYRAKVEDFPPPYKITICSNLMFTV